MCPLDSASQNNDLILCSMPSCFHFVIGIFLVLCVFFVRYEAGTEFSMECLIQLRWTSLVIHLFHSVFLSIGLQCTNTRTHLPCGSLFIYLFFFSWCTSFSYHNHIFTTKVIFIQAHQQHIYAHMNTLYYYQTYAFTQAYRSI